MTISFDELMTQFHNDIADLKKRVGELEQKCQELEQKVREQ